MHISLLNILTIMAFSLVYFLPAMAAISRHHLNTMSIFLTNLLLGVTGIGWVIALIWAFTNSSAAPAAAPPAPGSMVSAGMTMKLFRGLVAVLVVIVLTVAGAKALKGMRPPPDVVSVPAAKVGVPVPADELLGK
jgi:hypothetical protein